MQEIILFIEPIITPWTKKLVLAAKAMGKHTVLIKHEDDQSSYQKEFDDIYITTSWQLPVLRRLCDKLAKKYSIQALMSGHGMFTANTLHGESVSILAQEMNLPFQNVDGLYRSNNKYLMRDALDTAGIPNVQAQLLDPKQLDKSFLNSINYPCILKPTHQALSSFVSRCNNAKELQASITYSIEMMPKVCESDILNVHQWSNKAGEQLKFNPFSLMVEDYIDGIEGSVECIATENQVIPLLVHEKVMVTEKTHTVLENLEITPPVSFSEEDCENIRTYAKQCIEALGITNSLIHVEFRYNKIYGTRILEINPRVGGGVSIDRSIREFTGLDPATTLIQIMTGQFKAQNHYPTRSDLKIGMFSLFPEKDGILRNVSGMDDVLKSGLVEELNLTAPLGSSISCQNNEVFLVNGFFYPKDEDALYSTYHYARENIVFDIA